MAQMINILLVDDRPDGLLALEAVLGSPEYRLVKASSGQEALSCLLLYDFALILLDVQMPGMNGFEVAQKIKQNALWKEIPIIFLTAISKEIAHIYRGYDCGAVDYLFKPFDPWILKSKVAVFVDLYKKNKKLIEQAKIIQENERKEAQRQFEEFEFESRQHYRNLADAIPHIVWKGKIDGSLDYYNQVWLEYAGERGTDWQNAIDAEDLPRFLTLWSETLNSGMPGEMECRLLRHDGASRWHLVRVSLDRGRSGDITSWIATCTDIHDRKRAEKKLEEARLDLEQRVKDRTKELSLTHEALRDEMAERAKAQKEILDISEKEQKRIGQDLHDGLAQQLAGISFKSKILEQKLSNKLPEEAEEASEIQDLLKNVISETKRLAKGFYPIELERHGLLHAVRELAVNTEKMFFMTCHCDWDTSIKIDNMETERHLYRIIQEAINNALKHGKAKNIQVSFRKKDGMVLLAVENDGMGISHVPASMLGMGLRSMEYRAKMIGATFSIGKGPQGGTCVSLSFPEPEAAQAPHEGELLHAKNGEQNG